MTMKDLVFNGDKKISLTNLVRIGDLSYYEGPLLTLFEELNSGHFYIFDWVDRDMQANRWLIYRVKPSYLLRYIQDEISHLELFINRHSNKVYFTDIDYHNRPFSHYDAFDLECIPHEYFPNTDSFFDTSDCTAFDKIKSAIIASLSKQKQSNEYSKAYSITINKLALHKISCFNKVHLGFFKPQGNFSCIGIIRAPKELDDIHVNRMNLHKYRNTNQQQSVTLKRNEYANRHN